MTKRKTAPPKAAPDSQKRTRANYKDVINTFILDGIEGVEKLGELSKHTLAKAVKVLRGRERPCADLDELHERRFGNRVGKHPVRTPKPGEVRTYAAVLFRKHPVVNRIYLATLGNPKRVAVTHHRDRITIEAAPEDAA